MRGKFFPALLIVAVGVSMSAQSCDPEKAAMDVFKEQGLTLLRPARSYVTVGALVVVPPSGPSRYIDPKDSISTINKPTVDFDAVIQSKTKTRRTALGAALSGLARVVTIPVGLKYNEKREVELSQIDTGGVRLVDGALESLIKKQATATALKQHLQAKRKVFVIQEVYLTAAMSVSASSGTDLGVTLGGGSLPECSATETKAKEEAKAKEAAKASEEAKAKEATGKEGQKPAPSDSKGGAEGKKPASDSSSGASTAAEAKAPEKPSLSFGVCYGNEKKTTLAFKTENPLPFAVRLAEIEFEVLNKKVTDNLQVKVGDFKFPGSLGTSEVEKATAFPAPGNPLLRGLVRLEDAPIR
jgi:hypothetical protein